MKKMVRRESTKPRSKTGIANAPIAKDETTMLAENHCRAISAPPALTLPTFGNAHHCPHFHQVCVRPLIFRYSFDSSGLNAELENCSLDLGVEGVASDEDLGGYGRGLVVGVDWRSFLWVCAIWRIASHVEVLLVIQLVVHCYRGTQG